MKPSDLSSTNPKSTFLSFTKFKVIWQRFTFALICSNQLQVWKKIDRFGHSYWQAYDPKSGDSTFLGTEAEMRIWIEQSYYK